MVILTWSQTCNFTQLYQLFTKIHIKLNTFKTSKLMKPDIVGGLECTFFTCWKYYYIKVPPNLGQGFISLCVSFSDKSGHIYPCQQYYIIVWPPENMTWWWNKSYSYPILTLGWFSGAISTLIGVTLQDHHIPFFGYLHVFPNFCTDSSQSSTLVFTHSCFYLYDFCYTPMHKLLSINWTTRP